MSKRIFILALLLCFALVAPALAADKARAVGRDTGINDVVALSDGSSGDLVEIDSDGNLMTQQFPGTVSDLKTGDGQIITGACTIYSIIVTADTAGDYALLYDNTSATGTAKFDIAIGTNFSTVTIAIPCGATFSTGVYQDATDTGVRTTVVYDS